uniref:Dynein heavy chain n=1 Tax=Phytophthora ramorum TaxID=164328 RepID=H3HDY6_PHYRM
MQDHVLFGAPPKLRPRTAGVSRSSLPPNGIDYAASRDDKGVFMKPPMRPKSATAGKSASGAKRPHSAAASTRYQPFRAREKSTSSLTSLSVVSHTAKAPRSMSTSSSRGYSRGDRLLASTRESSDNTFVYAVPRHHFESGLPYDPYDIIPVTHEALFGGGSFNQLQDAHSDYYTISRSGYTFHLKSDNFQSTFLSLGDWEAQKAQFTQLRSLSTFSAFRYRKVFQGWRQLVRSNKHCYFSYPVLLKGMLEVRTELANISKQQLMWNFDGETISLENFAAAHTKFVKARTKEFRQVTARIQKVLSEARAALLMSSIAEHGTRAEKVNAFSVNQADELEDIRWTMASIKRRKCRQLTKFVMLIDFLLLDTFARVVKQSLELLSSFLLRGANAGTIKSFLHAAWEGKFRTLPSTTGDPAEQENSAAVAGLLEALLLFVLSKHAGATAEAFTVDDLFSVAESTLPQLLVLPHFTTANMSIYTVSGTENLVSTATANMKGENEDCEEHFRCPADRLVERMEEDRNYLSVRDEIQDLTRSALNGAQDLASCYAKVLDLRQQNESVNFDVKARQFRRNEYTLDQMKEDATNFTDQLAALETLKLCTDVEFLHFDMRQLQADLVPSPARCLDVMRELLPKLARERCDQFLHYISLSSAKIEKPVVQDLDAFTTYLLNLRDVYDEILDKGLDLTFLREFFHVLDTLKFNAPVETAKVFELCDPEFQALKSHVQEAYTSRDTDLQHYGPLLAESLNKLERRTSWLQSTTSGQEVAAQSSTCQDARDSAAKLYHEATEMQQEASRLTRIQRVFEEASNDLRPPSTTFEGLNALAVELKLKSELWEAVCEADEHLEACSTDTIRSVDLDTMGVVASRVDRVVENIRQCSAQVVGAFELDRLEKLQATLHGLAPVIRDLRNPHLAERHWSKLEHKMQCSLVSIVVETAANSEVPATLDSTDSTETLQLLDANAVAYGTTIRHVSEEASAEAAMAGSFLSVVRTWEAQEIPVESKKDRDGRDVFCIGDCIELTSLIEESQVLLRVMDLSTYSLVVQERLPKMLHDLEHTKESLELLQMCQRKWDYTQRLVSIDFARTFPEQAKQLQKYDGAWRSLTLGLYNRSLCLPFGVSPEHRQALKGILEGFEAAAKTLADHLLIKRQVFPAFFKLSDLELATLLSKCRDVGYIPSFLFQCFDNVGQIVFGTRDAFQDILQVTSRVYGDSEAIPMGKNLKARGPVEQWLAAVEKRLAEQLRRSTKQAIDILSRHDNSGSSLKLDTSHFPIQEIQFRDAFASHVASQQTGSASSLAAGGLAIDWEFQLKYRMDDATTVGHECHVQINTLSIPYGFNYLTPNEDTVVTPGSLRSLFSLFACVRHAQGCFLTGPSESGKRTLSMQVSSMLGRRSFSAAVTSYAHATRLLIGALHAGGTFCANLQLAASVEASAPLIKTLATTLASIEHAVLTKNPIVGLHRSPITFVPGTAMLVILPSTKPLTMADAEDIKIWTAPLCRFAVVQWDWTYIVEALLSSKGFAAPRELAKQLLALWQLESIALALRELHFVPRKKLLDAVASLADALTFGASAVLVGAPGVGKTAAYQSRRMRNVDPFSRMNVATAYLHRYLELQRELQRVTNLTSMLQSLLSTASSLPEPTRITSSDKAGADPTKFAQDIPHGQIRVEMALVYSLLWGFAASTGGQRAIQRQLSDMVRREFDHLTPAWVTCGSDVNLMETLLDLQELRFVPVLDILRAVESAGGVSNMLRAQNGDDDGDNARKPDRIRLRQITLVTRMALRLQKDSNRAEVSLQPSRDASVASIATASDNESMASVVEAEEGAPLAITPSTDTSKTAMTGAGDVATELANCLERMLQRERTGVFEPPPGKTALLILDDLHLAVPQEDAANPSSQLPLSPSVYAYLRYVHERGVVYRACSVREEPQRKLTSKFFPVLTPSCGLEELQHVFGQALATHWAVTLATAVRLVLPVVFAASTVLWDRLRATYKFCLHDLARVYEGLAGVGTSLLPDVETFLRLWTHECNRTLREPSLGLCSLRQDHEVATEIANMRSLMSQVAQRRASARASRLSLNPEAGLQDDSNVVARVHTCLAVRWKRLLLELYERVGVAGQEATLVVKRLDLLPPAIMNQLQALMTTGEVPGLFSLEEQVHLATRVCDERLLELKTKHAAQAAQIRSEAESTRDQALAILHQKQRDAPATPLLEAFQLVETRYQRELRSKLARVDLRWQQDSDDLRREREVESESVAATVMALTRPLGVTSGKWASAVARMCSKLRVVLLIDKKHERRVRSSSSNVFATCDVVSVPQLGRDSLRTLVFGHFHAQVQQLLGGNSPAETVRAFAMASIFAKLVVDGYKREEEARAKASWFLDLSNRLDRDLGALRSSDAVLSEQLTTIAQQLTTHAAKLVEQKEDAERIRTIMQRFQVAADEQILVTNEAQEVAQRELQEPMACLEEANRALLLVDRRHIVEIKSFVSPPPLVHLVLGAVCVLFQLEPSWESARRLLLGDANVVQTLLQFNKDAVSAATLTKLEAEFLRDERFCREEVERQSVAAASMVGWVRAIYQYASARHQVQPTLDKLEKAQSRLNLIMQEFQVSKQRVVEADEAWQVTQAAIDAATTRKEALTGEIASLGARCDSGGLAMQALQEDRQRQQGAASASSMRRGFSLTSWNALLSAGALAYACELSLSPRRDQVFQAWESAYCSYGGLAPGCPPTSTCCTFVPSIAVVLKDSALSGEQTRDLRMVHARSPDFDDEFRLAARLGHQLLVLDVEPLDSEPQSDSEHGICLHSALAWTTARVNGAENLADSVANTGGAKLKRALREHGQLAQQFEASHAQLTKLLEAAAVTSQFPLTQTQALRDRIAAIQEARHVLRDKRREIQEQLGLVKLSEQTHRHY